MENKKSLYADLSLLIVAIIWGSGFVVTKNALDVMSPFYINGARFLIAAAAVNIIFFKRLKKATKLDIKAGIIVGFFMFLGFAFQTVGLKYTTAGVQAFITASNVVMVPFLYWVISKKRPDNFEMFGAFLCFIGIGILSFDNNMRIGLGELLTFLCAIGFALQIVAVGYFAKDTDPIVLSTVQLYFAAILSFIIAFLFEPRVTNITPSIIFPMLYLGLVSSAVAFVVQNVAQVYTTSTHAAIILSLEAVFGSIFSIILLNEPVNVKFFIGCFAILISVIGSETKFEFLKIKKRTLD
jgi:drug/metabolite transporter (DMT)-like permease